MEYRKDTSEIMEKLHDGEPVFIIRAQDELAVEVIRHYEIVASNAGCDPSFLQGCLEARDEIQNWQVEHSDLVKRPD